MKDKTSIQTVFASVYSLYFLWGDATFYKEFRIPQIGLYT